MDNIKSLKTELDDELFSKGITHLIVTGIATDYCVQDTVLDALSDLTHPYTVTLVQDATAPVQGNMASFNTSVALMKSARATIVTTADVLAMECPTNTSRAQPAARLTACAAPPPLLIGAIMPGWLRADVVSSPPSTTSRPEIRHCRTCAR